ncbi:MAG: FHA domain-containing protein, partial [Acidobacteria bacterium]|nr:FHA domain-containing protein [Acidobacteriota bacterium]
LIGRLAECEIVLDHKSVSRIHATIIYRNSKYFLINLSSSNILTVNGRRLEAKKGDVLADGDTIQIGPFKILATSGGSTISLTVERPVTRRIAEKPADFRRDAMSPAGGRASKPPNVLSVFWKKRTRDDKDDSGTRLRPAEKPRPGKARFNWKPTHDLQRPWRFGLFIWAFLLIGAIGAFAYIRFPGVYALKPLSNLHASKVEGSTIAVASSGTSCTTCHTLNEPIENSCNKCHQAEEFHISNTKAHEEAGVTCTVCHREHQGADVQLAASAIQSCATCHNDNNLKLYNQKSVRTAHGGSYGYPVVDGVWKWKGVYVEVADAIPEISSSATGDNNDQARLSRHFHTVHLGRLKAPQGVTPDKRGFVSCSSCHKSQDPVDRVTPRQTCAACHTTPVDAAGRDMRFGSGPANCISCHTQHPYSAGRWNEFLSEDALQRRKEAVTGQIKQLSDQ